MGCNTSKGCLINGDDMESHYKYTYHKPPPPIRRLDSDNNLGPNTTIPPSSSSVLHGHVNMEIQGKRGNDNNAHAAAASRRRLLGSDENEMIMFPNNFLGEAPSFKDYLIPSDNDIINTHGSSDNGENEEDEEKRRIETPDNNYSSSVEYASAREKPSPIPIAEESTNKNDAILGEVCLIEHHAPLNDQVRGACVTDQEHTS